MRQPHVDVSSRRRRGAIVGEAGDQALADSQCFVDPPGQCQRLHQQRLGLIALVAAGQQFHRTPQRAHGRGECSPVERRVARTYQQGAGPLPVVSLHRQIGCDVAPRSFELRVSRLDG